MNDRENNRREPGTGHSFIKDNMLSTLPMALRGDKSIVALADAAAELLSRRPEEIERLQIYPAIERLDEKLLDILARDYKVDWWDADYSLDEKRRTMKDSWRVHKILGTKAAVETAIRAIYPDTTVKRWFEYENGTPYHFKLYIDLSSVKYDEARPWRVIEKVNFYKSLRDHLDRIDFTIKPKEDAILRLGGCLSTQIRIPVPELSDSYDFRSMIRVGGTGTVNRKVTSAGDSGQLRLSKCRPYWRSRSGYRKTASAGGFCNTADWKRPDRWTTSGAVHAAGTGTGITAERIFDYGTYGIWIQSNHT